MSLYGFINLYGYLGEVGRDIMDRGNIEHTTRSTAIVFVYLGDIVCNVH